MPAPHARRALTPVLALVCVCLLAACSSGTTAQPPAPPTTTAAAPAVSLPPAQPATQACPTPVTPRRGVLDDSLQLDGLDRTYRIWLPADYTGTTPLPMVVNYHGTGGNPQGIDAFSSNLSQKGNARGYIVVAPQALQGGDATPRWTVPGFGQNPDDVKFTAAMLDRIAAEFCVDAKRIYATGFSSGGAMTTWLACSLPDRFAAVAPGGGVNLVDPLCQKAPVAMLAYHGTADDIAYFRGIDGTPQPPNPQTAGSIVHFGGVELDMSFWAKGNGCTGDPVDVQLANDAILRTWQNCRVSTELLLAIGGGHTFPGGTTRLNGALGGTIQSVNMADLMLNFFDGQARL